MATLTTNISSVSLTVSGNSTVSGTISWSLPTIPAGCTATARTLTGKATASMSKGSATITVNGSTVSSGSNFTVNLGASSTTTSVPITVKGNNKNANGTVTFSNLVYTVEYAEPVVTYTVTFVDYNGTVLKTETVEKGKSATAPSVPNRSGYTFIGWNIDFTNVASDLTVAALYMALYTVTFVDYDETVLKTEEVAHGDSATPPEAPSRSGYEFIGWSSSFTNITSNITLKAQYIRIPTIKAKENGAWVNVSKTYKYQSGAWTEQAKSDWSSLFNGGCRYIKTERPVPTAVLYSDGTLVFSGDSCIDNSHGDVVNTYTGWDTDIYTSAPMVPWYPDRSNITKVYINKTTPKSTAYLFSSCTKLTEVVLSNFDTSNVIDMTDMFRACVALTGLDVSNFDTSKVTNMRYMFCLCRALTSLDVSNFDTSNVTDMRNMFDSCSNLTSLDVSNFDTSNVTDMSSMFCDCSNLTSLDVSNFDTSNVTDMCYMFRNCSNLTSLDISNFDTSNVTDMTDMFSGCSNRNLIIYVKDEITKTKIESSTGFPTTATVVIGSPN